MLAGLSSRGRSQRKYPSLPSPASGATGHTEHSWSYRSVITSVSLLRHVNASLRLGVFSSYKDITSSNLITPARTLFVNEAALTGSGWTSTRADATEPSTGSVDFVRLCCVEFRSVGCASLLSPGCVCGHLLLPGQKHSVSSGTGFLPAWCLVVPGGTWCLVDSTLVFSFIRGKPACCLLRLLTHFLVCSDLCPLFQRGVISFPPLSLQKSSRVFPQSFAVVRSCGMWPSRRTHGSHWFSHPQSPLGC